MILQQTHELLLRLPETVTCRDHKPQSTPNIVTGKLIPLNPQYDRETLASRKV
ncbi:hypothetical protein GIB67_014550 [Kingdonia uniflora]|uniref:Uncharacterized protein n=1 Tax=Kingdonia uniflora TaxID=39325 RepID=A0A7J7LK28_9MAGN|nr:hypothetical protein GIB67_014550 [Kingdonia uniflora]